MLNAGNGQLLTVNVAGTSNYNPSTKTVSIDVAKAAQIINWSNPAPIVLGTPLGSAQLNATVTGVSGGSPTGALTYAPGAGTLLAVNTQTLSVTAAATANKMNQTYYFRIDLNDGTSVYFNFGLK